jgi:hypothetical protein
MRTPRFDPAAAVTLLAVLAGGCGSLPERYSPVQLDRVGRELTTCGSIQGELGVPSLIREDGRLWIYTWEGALPDFRRSLLVLEFDAGDRLLHKELARDVSPSFEGVHGYVTNARYCTAGGFCIEHAIDTDEGIRFDSSFSAVTVRGDARERFAPPGARPDECLLVIWPAGAWSRSRSTVVPPDGVAVSIEGAAPWSHPRWLPTGAYARIVLPAGEHLVSVRDPVWEERMADQDSAAEDFTTEWWIDLLLGPPPEKYDLPSSTASFRCPAGESVHLNLDATFKEKDGHWFPIVLRPVDAAAAQTEIATMRRVLPPDH